MSNGNKMCARFDTFFLTLRCLSRRLCPDKWRKYARLRRQIKPPLFPASGIFLVPLSLARIFLRITIRDPVDGRSILSFLTRLKYKSFPLADRVFQSRCCRPCMIPPLRICSQRGHVLEYLTQCTLLGGTTDSWIHVSILLRLGLPFASWVWSYDTHLHEVLSNDGACHCSWILHVVYLLFTFGKTLF